MAASQADETLLGSAAGPGWAAGDRLAPRRAGPRRVPADRRHLQPDLPGGAGRRGRGGDPGGAQGRAARARTAAQPRRAAPGAAAAGGPGEPAAAGTGRALLRPGRPAGRPAVHGDEPGRGGVRGAGAERGGRAARARPGAGPVLRRRARCSRSCTGSSPPRWAWATSRPSGSPTRSTGGPARSPPCRRRWRATTSGPPRRCGRACPRRCRRRSTTATTGSGTPCAKGRGSTRSSTGRSGRWATRASTCPG